MEDKENKNQKNKNSSEIYSGVFLGVIGIIFFLFFYFFALIQPPKDFPINSYISYKEGQYLDDLTNELSEKKYVNSRLLFKVFIKLSGQENRIKAGEYYFDEPLNISQVAYRFVSGDFNQDLIRVTIPEGSNDREIIAILKSKNPGLSEQKLKNLFKGREGYHFPDTYFFYQNATEEEIVEKINSAFDKKVMPVLEDYKLSEEQKEKIIILASLLEEEGKKLEDKSMIAGILINRLNIGMRLQVDATINYLKGENSRVYFRELEIDSPYNTYRYEGLPPGAISNPGLESIQAALNPTESDYLYYLTGSDGNFYYAKTFEGHTVNRQKYLR